MPLRKVPPYVIFLRFSLIHSRPLRPRGELYKIRVVTTAFGRGQHVTVVWFRVLVTQSLLEEGSCSYKFI